MILKNKISQHNKNDKIIYHSNQYMIDNHKYKTIKNMPLNHYINKYKSFTKIILYCLL